MKGLGIISFVFIFLSVLFSSCNNSSPTAPIAKPVMPTLNLPSNGAVNQPVTAMLAWSPVSNAATYHVQVSSSSDFSLIVAEDSSVTAASDSVPWLIDSTIYYWRVSAKNASGVSAWSGPWNFTTLKDSSFWEFGRSQGYLGYWAANDLSGITWLFNFKGNTVVISNISQSVDTVTVTVIYDTTEIYGGIFTLDSSVTPNAMDIYLTSPAPYKGQMILTIYDFLPPEGSFEECYLMMNTPGAPRSTVIDKTSNNFLDFTYQWTH